MYRVRNELFVASHDGSSPRKITQTSARPQQFSFAPDGRRFRFTDYDANTSQTALWEAQRDGSGLHLLLPGWREPPQDCCGQWNSDGKYFFFLTTRDATNNVWVLSDESSFWRKPLNTPAQMAAGPLHFSELLPSKDGKRLFAVGVKSQGELVRYDAKSEQFVPYLGGISAGYVELSRDEQWATYVAYPEGTLWRSKVDGTERLQLPGSCPWLPPADIPAAAGSAASLVTRRETNRVLRIAAGQELENLRDSGGWRKR